MTGVSWSHCDGQDCLRVHGVPAGAAAAVRPAAASDRPGLPATAGSWVRRGADLCFVPRFGFVEGATYVVSVGDVTVGRLDRERVARSGRAEVRAIYPSSQEVPRNLLRLYIWFSAPMSEGGVATHVRLVDGAGEPLAGAIMPSEYELWDPGHRRLTVFLDPARIKRGLVAHLQTGYPLRAGDDVRLIVDDGLVDARGVPLGAPAETRYTVGADERRLVDPAAWTVGPPAAGTRDPLHVVFDRPLDHGLLTRCLQVLDAGDEALPGTSKIGPLERSWTFEPAGAWDRAPHRLSVNPILEDLAGNSLRRVFDRELDGSGSGTGPDQAVALWVSPL